MNCALTTGKSRSAIEWQGYKDGRKTRFGNRRNVLCIGNTYGFHQLRRLMVLTPSAPKIEQLLGCCLNPFCSNKDIKQNLNPFPGWSERPAGTKIVALSLL